MKLPMKPSKYLLPLLFAALVTGTSPVEAKTGGKGSGQHTIVSLKASGAGSHAAGAKAKVPMKAAGLKSTNHKPSMLKASGAARDKNGKIQRSETAKNQFKKSHHCPSTGKASEACPGYVIDHVQALKHGGADAPANMQWQTKAAARQKDKTE